MITVEPNENIAGNVIDFKIRHMIMQLPKAKQNKIFAFNSQFYEKLTELKDSNSHFRWSRVVNLFELDFILIPINYLLHWSLCVIVKPGELMVWIFI